MRYAALSLLLAATFAVGCSGSDADTGDPQAGKQEKTPANPTTPAGKWLVVVSRFDAPRETQIAVIEIGIKQGGEYIGKILGSSDETFPDAKLAKTNVSGKDVQLLFVVGENGRLEVHGSLDGEVIYGNAPTNGGLQPVRLVRIDGVPDEFESVAPTEGAEEYEAALDGSDRVADLKKFTRQFPTSPTALAASLRLLGMAKNEELDAASVKQILDRFLKTAQRWGPRLAKNSRLDAASILVQQQYLPDLAIETLETLKKSMQDEQDEELKSRFQYTEVLARTLSPNEATRTAGAALLTKLQQESPLDHRMRIALAEHLDRSGDKQEALKLYAELAALPDGEAYFEALGGRGKEDPETAAEASERLWQALHGNTDGLKEYRRQAYDALIHHLFAAEGDAAPASPLGTQTALCELFTGAACPPCVAADLATVGLEANYPMSNLIVLRYHQHIPLPDPLTNADSETRFDYYKSEDGPQGTPAVVLNGEQVEGIAGPFAYSRLMFGLLREKVDPAVKLESKLKIRLAAAAKEGRLSIDAAVDGAQELPETARLRLVLAEDAIRYDARNGIRLHEMVVRHMPAGPDGVAIEEGRLAYRANVTLASIKEGLNDYLDAFEKQFDTPFGQPRQIPGIPFPVRPLDLKPLHLVAFVQDDETKQILQAASIPVGGELDAVGEADAPPAPDESGRNRPVQAPIPSSSTTDSGKAIAAPQPKSATKEPKTGPRLVPRGDQ